MIACKAMTKFWRKMASRNIFRHFSRANFVMFVALLKSNQTSFFFVQFEINLHLWVFQKDHSCKLIPNWGETIWLPILSFCAGFANMKLLSLLYTSQCTLSATARKGFVLWNWKELPYRRLCQMCARSCYRTGWPTPLGSWKLNDPPLTRGSKTDDTPRNTFWPVP